MNDFKQTPFGDPIFAAIAKQHGHKPEHINWEGWQIGQSLKSEVHPPSMPRYRYNQQGIIDAHLSISMNENGVQMNYSAGREGQSLLLFKTNLSEVAKQALTGKALKRLINIPGAKGHIITGFTPVSHVPDAVMVLIEPRISGSRGRISLEDIPACTQHQALPVKGLRASKLASHAKARSIATPAYVTALVIKTTDERIRTTGWITNTLPDNCFKDLIQHRMTLVEHPEMHLWLLKMVVKGLERDAADIEAKAVTYRDGRQVFAINPNFFS